MNNESRKCPYPGLRPFNQDEAIFFKGREKHVLHITNQLSEKKFLMLTGASGDGKSSLVYAGLIPNAKAGFFKAKHNNWVVADFRPERNPLKNLSIAIDSSLGINNLDYVENELKYGFSALVDVYKASPCYLDTGDKEFIYLNDEQKRLRKKNASNLLIIVDQFEEFFTNVENYSKGKPSNESYAVINTLLETATLSLKNDLPIYIICTMRSDFIGQCASFRGLPEFIGFSQFFVPRLKRHEIYQVIEKPAVLNGDRISKRLVEILLNSLDDGFDQLPVLQHALNQIWHLADNGQDELDLIHLAKAGGLEKRYLDENYLKIFEAWLDKLPNFQKKYYDRPNLSNVLNSHANFLYEISAKEVNDKLGTTIVSDSDAKYVIEIAFRCLSKMDNNRAVRYRITLEDIVHIINKPHLSINIVSEILLIFRKQGNTFLKPYIENSDSNTLLTGETILDITHESLIRNWTLLTNWANIEHENYLNYLDLNKQLERWLENNKTKDYLLPVGSLKFFEKWLEKTKPNKYWLFRYDDSLTKREKKMEIADIKVNNIYSFIRGSRKKITRERSLLIGSISMVIVTLSIITLFAISESNKANKETKLAEEKTKEAINEKAKAETANNLSVKAAKQAIEEKANAESRQAFAMAQMKIADSQKANAEQQRKLALQQMKIAAQNAEEAKKQTNIAYERTNEAIEQRMNAEEATSRATKLSLINLSQNIAFKSIQINNDIQLSGLLSYEAWQLAMENNAEYLAPDLYAAIFNSLKKILNADFPLKIKSETELAAIGQIDNKLILWHTNGKIDYCDKSGNIINTRMLKDNKSATDYFISKNGKWGVTTYENFKIKFWDIFLGKSTELLAGHNGFVRCVAFFNNGTSFFTGGRDSCVKLWKANAVIQNIAFNARVKSIDLSEDEQNLVVGCEDGAIYKYDIKLGKKEKITNYQHKIQNVMFLNAVKNFVTTSTSNGDLTIVDVNSHKKNFTYSESKNIEQIGEYKNEYIIDALSNRMIHIFNTHYLNTHPVEINEITGTIKSMIISKDGYIYVATANTVYTFPIEIADMAKILKSKITRNLTKEEWESYIGSNVDYKKTIN